jgi:hypothetical protein
MPKPLSDAIEQQAKELFGTLPDQLKLKCRYMYLHGKIEAIQQRGGTPAERYMRKLDDLEEKLSQAGIEVSSLLPLHDD